MRVAAYQGPLLDVGTQEALHLVRERVRECEANKVDVLCCPEGFLGGLADYNEHPSQCAIRSEELASALAPLASESVTTIVGLSELGADGKLYNTAAVAQRGRILGLYRKIHPAIRKSVYAAGSHVSVFQVEDLMFGILICNDSNYPELARTMSAQGATAILIPTNNGLPGSKAAIDLNHAARRCDIAMAIENRCWIVRADVCGSSGALTSFGCSEIVDPSGVIVQEAQDTGLLIVEIPAANLEPART